HVVDVAVRAHDHSGRRSRPLVHRATSRDRYTRPCIASSIAVINSSPADCLRTKPAAPPRSASLANSESAYMVRKITLVTTRDAFKDRRDSMPFIPGIEISVTTTSG